MFCFIKILHEVLHGILLGRVVVVERGSLRGREQEWNISRRELLELVCTFYTHEHSTLSLHKKSTYASIFLGG